MWYLRQISLYRNGHACTLYAGDVGTLSGQTSWRHPEGFFLPWQPYRRSPDQATTQETKLHSGEELEARRQGSVCVCWVRRMNIWRHEMRREDEGIHTLRSMKAEVTGLRLKISGQALIKNIGRSNSGVRSNTQKIGNLEESNRRRCTALYLNS